MLTKLSKVRNTPTEICRPAYIRDADEPSFGCIRSKTMHLIRLMSVASMLLLSHAVLAHEGPNCHSPSQVPLFSALESQTPAHPALHTSPEGRASVHMASN